MSSTRWSERLERETRRESSKKTKHRVGKKFGTIFSKRSSAAGARFKETSFVQFFLNSDRSFVTEVLPKKDSIKDIIEICTKKQWNFLSFKTQRMLSSSGLSTQTYSSLSLQFSNLLNTKFYPCWFQGASKTNIIWFDFLNVADVSSSHEHVFSYLSQGTCFNGNIASTAWKYVYHTFYFGFPFLYPLWNYHNQKCIQYHKCVWKGPTNVSMYCNNLAGVNC